MTRISIHKSSPKLPSHSMPIARPGVLKISPYVGGDRGAESGKKLIRLASNENNYGPSPKAIAAYQSRASLLHRYPDGSSADLRAAIAEIYNFEVDRLICGNGSDELLHLAALAYAGPGDEILYSQHGFLVYPIAAHLAGAMPVTAPEINLTSSVDHLLAAVTPKTKIVFLANPNNPTGSYLPKSEVIRLHRGLPPQVLLVLDAAYAEFVTEGDYESGAELARAAENIMLTHTFSKIYGLAGLRLGFAYAAPAIIDALNRIRGPFNINEAASAAGIAAVHDQAYVTEIRQKITATRAGFAAQLRQLGLTPRPSVANFILIDFGTEHRAQAANAWLKQNGILTRLVTSYGLPHYVRMTLGTDAEMHEVSQSLSEFIARG
ncbi:MAG: histidinol-phosphate transaminase [Alphaproteobacteria bacterium]|nr:histidinol-phosphate transaminase [Alphaproteobacteria bacterium]